MTATRHFILVTAGHIDHGKSSLVLALTGTDPDRLPEEKSRGMTIELGFAHLVLPATTTADRAGDAAPTLDIGIVDVPGHERFIRTMVAGATGMDLAMLVVAADDGVMPQTREHIEILDLLGASDGLIVISKRDLVVSERISDVRTAITAAVDGTCLKRWPLVEASARTGEGLDAIRNTLRSMAETGGRGRSNEVFRLAIDRVFTIHGRGTVVTGSALSGVAQAGSTLELLPAGLPCKVREVQSHGAAAQGAGGGQRAALNLTGVEKAAVERGMELATPGYLTASRYLDARVRVLRRLEAAIESHRRVRVCIGTTEAMAMLVVIGGSRIEPGHSALVQLRFLSPIVAGFGQRFILRNESAQTTLGGGDIVRPVSRRIRPNAEEVIAAVCRAASTDSFERFCEAIRESKFDMPGDMRLSCAIGVSPSQVPALRARMADAGLLLRIGSRAVHRDTVGEIVQRAVRFLRRHHVLHPTEPGLSRDRLVGWVTAKTATGVGREIVSRLESGGEITCRGPFLAHRDFRPALSTEDAAAMARIVNEISASAFDPPPWPKLTSVLSLSKQRAAALENLARTDPGLVAVGPQQYISAAALTKFRDAVSRLGTGGRRFKLSDVRDRLGLTRRVVQPLLEYLDRIQFTRRIGDERLLVEPR